MYDKRILTAVAKYSSGCCTEVEFLCSVSHCCDNVTQELNQNDDSESSTDEFELDTKRLLPAAVQQLRALL